DALLGRWRDGRIEAIGLQAGGLEAGAKARLRRLFDLYLDRANPRGMAIELAIRDWARRDAKARAAAAAVDAARLATVAALFAALGHAAEEAAARALAFYAFIFGQSLIGAGLPTAKARRQRERCARLLIG